MGGTQPAGSSASFMAGHFGSCIQQEFDNGLNSAGTLDNWASLFQRSPESLPVHVSPAGQDLPSYMVTRAPKQTRVKVPGLLQAQAPN